MENSGAYIVAARDERHQTKKKRLMETIGVIIFAAIGAIVFNHYWLRLMRIEMLVADIRSHLGTLTETYRYAALAR